MMQVWMLLQRLCTHTRSFETFRNRVGMQTGHNFIIIVLSIAKFISERGIGSQPMSNCPGLNIDDESIFHRGSMKFKILSSVIVILGPSHLKRCSDRLRKRTKLVVE